MNSVHHFELCQFLINAGALMYARDCIGNTVLHLAIEKGYLKTVKLLLDFGFDPNTKNNFGDDGIQFASLRGKELVVAELVARQIQHHSV